MVNGNYVLYGDKPFSESAIVDDHVHARTVDRKCKRKAYRSANELQLSLNMVQRDNETDSIKYEKKIKEPRLLRYVPTTDVEENFVTDKFETYDLKPTEERPRRYAFAKKPKNSSDGSVNYAYSRSSSSCSSPTGNNLPTISEHVEHYGTYRARAVLSPRISETIPAYENKLDKYFTKPREVKSFAVKGSHPDSLYRVPNDSTITSNKFSRIMRLLRWPVTLVVVCIALAVFVYFLIPAPSVRGFRIDNNNEVPPPPPSMRQHVRPRGIQELRNIDTDVETVNGTYWETIEADAQSHRQPDKPGHKSPAPSTKKENRSSHHHGPNPTEIDFYDAENNKNNDLPSVLEVLTETKPNRKLPVPPVFPSHITPEVQYGNEKADVDKLRTPKILGDTETLPEDSTLKPHITQKPEKPLAIYFNNGNAETATSTETINDFVNIEERQVIKNNIELISKIQPSVHKAYTIPTYNVNKATQYSAKEVYRPDIDLPPELQEYYARRPAIDVNFTSGHSKLFGISIEDAEKMQSTTQSSVYNTRVSPTLPTWRDGDDATTKKYPTNINSEVPQCRSTRLALCRGVLPYDLSGPAATIQGVEITTLLSQIEYLVATNCSDRVRHFACALLEPECNPPPYPPKIPCYNLCKAVLDNCEGYIPRELTPAFKCNQYSNTNCVAAKSPCYPREKACGDGVCIPRDWVCDGNEDCPGGEDEASCVQCEKHEYRCRSGGCILKRWLCDGYADCPEGEDEDDASCAAKGRTLTRVQVAEPGEESAGSAPAPAVRRPNRLPTQSRQGQPHGENDNSKELLMTSDSGNPYKRNFTRRPSPSRLVPYTRQVPDPPPDSKEFPAVKDQMRKLISSSENTTPPNQGDSKEDVNIEDMDFFDDLKKTSKEMLPKQVPVKIPDAPKVNVEKALGAQSTTRLDKSINKLEKVIDGAAMLKEAVAGNTPDNKEEEYDSTETNVTSSKKGNQESSISAHVSPCPSGELRCVDGRCITLAQLCDGTIDCSDHADEDNCYT